MAMGSLPGRSEIDGADASRIGDRPQERDQRRWSLIIEAEHLAERGDEPDGAPITDARGPRSYVTSAGPAPSLGRYVMLAYLPPERAVVGAQLCVDYLGRRHPVEVVSHGRAGAFDPDGSRMRS
ncbi:Putative Dimethylglycine oxidase [Frigoribacterium sp. JB110]|nr:Putative Dimethylglycine oxidase [Frigoribacterium sp. JB110]